MKAFEYVIFAWDVLCAFPRRRAVDRRVMNALKRVGEIGDGWSGHRLLSRSVPCKPSVGVRTQQQQNTAEASYLVITASPLSP